MGILRAWSRFGYKYPMLQDIAEWLLFGFVAGAFVGLIVGCIAWLCGYQQHFWLIMVWAVGILEACAIAIALVLSQVHF